MADKGLRTVVQRARQFVTLEVAGSLSDRELLDQYVRCRDEAAFTALVERHTAMILGVCRRVLKHGQDAEDAGQATFLVLARTAASIHKRTALASWLYGVAYRISRKMYTAQTRRRLREERAGGTGPGNPPQDASWREVQAALDEALMALPEKYRAPLVLCYLEERTRDEAAQLLGLTLSTLRGRLERGRGQVRADLARRGITLSGGLLLAALTADTGSAAVPAAFAAAAVRAAFARSVGPAPARVALLADGAVKTIVPTRMAIACALLLVLGLGAGAGIIGQPSERADEPPTDSVQLAPAAEAQPQQAEPLERRDRHGDPLPLDAVARLGTVRFRPGGHVASVAFTPDGKQLVAFGLGNDMSVWDAASGKELLRHDATETGKRVALRDALLTPDGRHVVTLERLAKGMSIRIRDRVDLKVIREFAVDRLHTPRLTPDGKQLIALRSDDHSDVEVWDLEAGTRVRSWRVHDAAVRCLDLARDGKTVATGADKNIRVWDVATGTLIHELAGLERAVNILALAPNGKLVAAASLKADASEFGKFGPFKVFPWNNRIHIWDVESGKELCRLQMEARDDYGGHAPRFHSAMFAPDGKLVTVCSDSSLRIWDARTGKLDRQIALGQHSLMRLAFSPDGQTLAIGTNGIQLLDWATGKDKHPEFGHVYSFSALAITPDGRTVVTCNNGPIQVWDAATGQLRRQLAGHDPVVINRTALRLLPDGQTLVSAGTDKTLRLWDLATGNERRRTAVSFIGLPMAFTGDGALVALTHEDLSIRLVETATGKERLRIPVGGDQFNPAAFTADGRTLVVWHIEHTAGVWDVATGREMRRIAFPERRNPTRPDPEWYTAAVSPDGRFIGYGSADGRVALYEVATGRQFRLMEGLAKDGVGHFVFSPDGRSLAWSDRGQPRVNVLELATGKERTHFDGHHGSIHGLAYAADGRTLVSSSLDTTALVWDVTRSRSAKGAALDPDAAWLALAQGDAATAYDVMCRLAAVPKDAIALLQQRIVPAPRPDEKHLAKLITELDSPQFEVRDAAGKELAKLGDTALPACRAAVPTAASIEARRRLQGLMDQQAAEAWTLSPERLRWVRSVEILEMAATAECRALLERLADGAPGALLTEEAGAGRRRLAKR